MWCLIMGLVLRSSHVFFRCSPSARRVVDLLAFAVTLTCESWLWEVLSPSQTAYTCLICLYGLEQCGRLLDCSLDCSLDCYLACYLDCCLDCFFWSGAIGTFRLPFAWPILLYLV